MRPASLLLLTALVPLGCATAEPRPTREQACRGTAINLDRVAEICAVPGAPHASPPVGALEAEIRPTPLHVQAGDVLQGRVRLTNATAAPLEVDITFGCMAFEANALREDGTVANQDEGDVVGGLCSNGATARVTLESGGWTEKEFSFTAARTRIVCPSSPGPDQPCQEVRSGNVDPGTYRLQIQLPFTDKVPDHPQQVTRRLVEAPVVVTRPAR